MGPLKYAKRERNILKQESSNSLHKDKIKTEWLTFPVHSTPFQIEKQTSTQASARVPTRGQRSSPGSSRPLDSWCMLRLRKGKKKKHDTDEAQTTSRNSSRTERTARADSADLLPELGDGAGQVGRIRQAVVGEAFLCVPGVVTALPRQLLHTERTCLNKRCTNIHINSSHSKFLAPFKKKRMLIV